MKSTSSGSGLRSAARQRLGPAVGDEAAADLGLDLLLQLLDAGVVLVLQQPLLERGQLRRAAPRSTGPSGAAVAVAGTGAARQRPVPRPTSRASTPSRSRFRSVR